MSSLKQAKMPSLLVFLPNLLCHESPGYLLGKVVHDEVKDTKKFYILRSVKKDSICATSLKHDVIGFYSGSESRCNYPNHRISDWLNVYLDGPSTLAENHNYCLGNVYLNNQKIAPSSLRIVLIIYDQNSFLKSELFETSIHGDHFSELKEMLQHESVRNEIGEKTKLGALSETTLVYFMLLFVYPTLLCYKITNCMRQILKYSMLGTHLGSWFENLMWIVNTVIENKRFTLKTGNLVMTMVLDVILGIFVLKMLLYYIDDKPPSQLLLDNAEKVVQTLLRLINWLMGSPAGLKLNHSFNSMLGKFFLYHIRLWWTTLKVLKPVLEFAFKILLLFGRFGVTFQISIIADLLALISFHTYCIYVYAARLFKIQFRGLIALFRLFLGKKKNPLRERVDSCQYQPDQLFIGTLFFTILVFLIPTTWVYYTVFTMLRLIMIGLSGFLTRLRLYLQLMPVYAFLHWIFRSHSVKNSVDINLVTERTNGPVTLLAVIVVSSWSETWKHCIPDTVNFCPPVNWSAIAKNVYWGELLYPL